MIASLDFNVSELNGRVQNENPYPDEYGSVTKKCAKEF